MTQLQLTEIELAALGFTKQMVEGKEFFELPGINSSFIYNPDEPLYRWYHKTVIGEAANWIHLNIQGKPTLEILLNIFRLKVTP